MNQNQPSQPDPKHGMPNKQKEAQKSGQQTQQSNRPGQGGYSSPGHGSGSGQSAPTDKK